MSVILQVGVKALLKNKKGKYLLLKRSRKKYPDTKGVWDIVGGRIKAGTTLLENLQREIKEETGLILTEDPTVIAAQDIILSPEKHIVRLTYTAYIDGEVVLDTRENEAYIWVTRKEIKEMVDIDYYFRQLLGKFMQF